MPALAKSGEIDNRTLLATSLERESAQLPENTAHHFFCAQHFRLFRFALFSLWTQYRPSSTEQIKNETALALRRLGPGLSRRVRFGLRFQQDVQVFRVNRADQRVLALDMALGH
jgi:hypothetical protein